MAQVITFESYRPIARHDSIPWTQARIEEGPESDGPWTIIDTVALTPVDPDPANPAVRDLTTELASDTPNLWYRIVFLDATGDSSQATRAVQNTTPATAAAGTEWILADDVALCCDLHDGSDTSVYDTPALLASTVLFEMSGRQYPGVQGPVTVRPCACSCPRPWVCGCPPLSEIKLAGAPIRSVTSVKIDGAEVAEADNWRLDGRMLVRLRDPAAPTTPVYWPTRQILDLDDDQDSTWSVSYTFGADPPQLAIDAAVQLACELAKACDADVECALPSGVTRIVRQGITIETVSSLAALLRKGATGLVFVDTFIATVNPTGTRRRPAVWSPDVSPFPRRTG